MKKGLELPINVLVIIVVAVIVLITLVVLIFTTPSMSCDSAKASACLRMVQDCSNDPKNIKVANFTQNGRLITNLQEVCSECYGKTTANECRKFCGCSVP
ncbi:MAG: hypothetical protein QXU82_01410 [Candidatus Aenigmatarchaeota archaeon]